MLEDPTIYVINKMEAVFHELNVDVVLYNIYEKKNEISLLPNTLKNADGVILATTVEWLGIGGYMSQFLDACWLYADKSALSNIYMQPVVLSTTYGEREAMVTLENAWDILGGLTVSGICGYVEDIAEFKDNKDYQLIFEKKVESMYRAISQKTCGLPSSNQAVTQSVLRTTNMDLSPAESEQLSRFVADDIFVTTQKADIADLSSLFKDKMEQNMIDDAEEYIMDFRNHYVGAKNFAARYLFMIDGQKKPLYIEVDGPEIEIHYGREENIDMYLKLSSTVMDHLIAGRKTFFGAFSMGDMTAKGNARILRMLDEIFDFQGR